MKRRHKILCAALVAMSPISLTSCGNGQSRLSIVHFDQSILGETSKDLGVSIGLRKGSDELKESLNGALSTISQETRNEWMTLSVERANLDKVVEGEGLQTIPSDKVLYVALECNYAPFNWTETTPTDYTYPIEGLNDQYAAGYDVLIAHELARVLNYNLKIVKMGWDALIPWVEAGATNNENRLIIAGMTDTEERRLSIDFTNEYWRSELVLVVKENSKYATATSLEDFEDARIVSQISTITNDVISTWEEKYNVKHLNPLSTFADCSIAVQNGAADAMTAELPVATSIVNGANR